MVRKQSLAGTPALWAAISGSLVALCSQAHAQNVVAAGKVVSVEGKVLIRQDVGSAAAGQAVPMKPGLQVKEGDVINTASDGKVKIMLEDKTIVDIGPAALFKVQKFEGRNGGDRNVDLSMPYGTTRVSVSKPILPGGKFQIRTKTATMGVRGTEFVVQSVIGNSLKDMMGGGKSDKSSSNAPAANKAETKITVIQGKVEVQEAKKEAPKSADGRTPAASSSAPVMLTAGKQLTSSSDAPAAKPVTLDTAQLNQVAAASKVQDNTFSNAVTLDLKGNDSGGGSGGAGGSGESAAGAATRLAISEAIAAPQNQAPQVLSNAGFIGTFSPTNINTTPPVVIPVGGLRTIHIVVK